jgi:small conductance mechanosensitive channel
MNSFSEQLSESYTNLVEKLSGWLNEFILQLPNIFIAIVVASLAYFFSKYFRKAAVKTTAKFTSNRTVLNLISNLSAVIFGLIVLFIVLSVLNLGDTINKILATAGVLGLAIGLALQDPMNNLFSGVFMSVRELYKIGDLVETNDHFGVITDIDLRATKLRVPTGQIVIIPNKDVIQNPLKNYSTTGERRVDVSCGISYGDDLEKVEKLVLDTISSLPSILNDKPIDMVFNEFGDSSINFLARFWVDGTTQRDYLIAQSAAIKAIKKAFDDNDIMIPYPIRTLDFGIKGGVPMSEMLHIESSSKKNLSTSTMINN